MGTEGALRMPGFWDRIGSEIEQISDTQKHFESEAQIYLCLIFTALPFSLFLTSMAFGQAHFASFTLCIFGACLIAGSPLVITAFNQGSWKNFMTDDECFTWTTVDPFVEIQPTQPQIRSQASAAIATLQKHRQNFEWQGWQIHHVSMPHAQSEVPIMLVHGFGGSIGHWRHNIPVLAQHHSVYAIDLLGFGDSDKPDTSYSLDLWVEQVYEFWRSFIKVPVVLVGNSLGSLTCLSVAAAHPEMVRGVAMISLPDAAAHHSAIPQAMRLLVSLIQAILLSPVVLRPLFHVLSHPWLVKRWAQLAYACNEAVTDELLEILLKPSKAQGAAKAFCSILRAMLSPQFSPNLQAIFSKLHTPLLLLWGKQDRMIPSKSKLAYRYLHYSSTLKLVELEDAGHCAHDECPDRVNNELLTWIRTQILTFSPDRVASAA